MENIEKRIEELEEKFACKIEKLRNEFNEVPEFEVGDWVVRTKHINESFYSGKIFKIGNIGTKGAKESGDEWIHSLSSLCLATHDKIQAHLSKICCKKYLGKKVKCLFFPMDLRKIVSDDHPTRYENERGEDQYWMEGENKVGICVYQDGVFAEIIEETKALPKNIGELTKLFYDWLDEDDCTLFKFTGFNKDLWCDAINAFFKRQGYL